MAEQWDPLGFLRTLGGPDDPWFDYLNRLVTGKGEPGGAPDYSQLADLMLANRAYERQPHVPGATTQYGALQQQENPFSRSLWGGSQGSSLGQLYNLLSFDPSGLGAGSSQEKYQGLFGEAAGGVGMEGIRARALAALQGKNAGAIEQGLMGGAKGSDYGSVFGALMEALSSRMSPLAARGLDESDLETRFRQSHQTSFLKYLLTQLAPYLQ